MRAATQQRPLRAAAVLALLCGLLSMHALVVGDHRRGHGAGVLEGRPLQQVLMHAMSAAGHGAEEPRLAALGIPTGGDLPVGAAVGLCLAMLGGLALIWRRAGRCRLSPTSSRLPRVRRAAASPPGRGPPRLLLAQLCVLRT